VISSASLRNTNTEVWTVADLKHYQDAAGHVFSLNESDARLLGYTLVEKPKAETKPAAPAAPATPPEGRGR